MGRTVCTEPQRLYSRAIPLLPLWAVRLAHSLSACTVELYLYALMGRTACTEPQCLYKGAIYLYLVLVLFFTVRGISLKINGWITDRHDYMGAMSELAEGMFTFNAARIGCLKVALRSCGE